jgi:pimeloyl-ACP methyl ester carboxylesterase
VDAGFRLIVPNRPGYGATATDHGTTARDVARMARSLLDSLGIRKAAIIGTSGGGPSALAFADLYPGRTWALILQCAASHTWSESMFVSKVYQNKFATARLDTHARRLQFYRTMNAGADFSDFEKHLYGMAAEDLMRIDPATEVFQEQLSATLDPSKDILGRQDDVVRVFLSRQPYFGRGDVKSPTLLIHDPDDQVVPRAHAEHTMRFIEGARWVEVSAGHMIWLGKDAGRMQKERVEFLRSLSA